MQRWIIRIGVVLMAILGASYFAVALIASTQGTGGLAVSHTVSGRPSFFLPIAALSLVVPLICVAAYWAWRKLANRSSTDVAPNPALKGTRRERRVP